MPAQIIVDEDVKIVQVVEAPDGCIWDEKGSIMCRSESESGSDIEEFEVGSLDLGAGLSGYEAEWSETPWCHYRIH